jgi:2-haloalkanoic acid dehalogenase type II
MRLPKAITFDNFGTIIDWEGGIAKFFGKILEREGHKGANAREVQRYWEIRQFDYIREQYRPYRQVLKDTLPMAFDNFGYRFTPQDLEDFADSMGKWQPFPDSHDALLEIKKYTKIALITNTDNDIIKESVEQIGVEFDDIVTAETARAYKPSHKGFILSQKRLGLTEKEIWHAGFGFKYDMVPAAELGYVTCWVNRQGEVRPVNVQETYLCGDLKTLALIIKGIAFEEDR